VPPGQHGGADQRAALFRRGFRQVDAERSKPLELLAFGGAEGSRRVDQQLAGVVGPVRPHLDRTQSGE
jgi:hypothetical protein